MSITLKTLQDLLNKVAEKDFESVNMFLSGLLGDETPALEAKKKPGQRGVACCFCGSMHVIGNGTTLKGTQRYRCKDCGKSFCETTGAVTEYTHQTEQTWRSLISDTIEGLPIMHTARALGLSTRTIYSMRHKVLCGIETALSRKNIILEGINQADEVFIRESCKGTPLPANYYRVPRKHGPNNGKIVPDTIDKKVVVCTSVSEKGNTCVATPVKYTAVSGDDLVNVFSNIVNQNTVIVCDNSKIYNKLSPHCLVTHDRKRINRVNSFHRAIKDLVVKKTHGVATKYLRRYISLNRQIFGKGLGESIEEIFAIVMERDNRFVPIADLRVHNLLKIA